MPKPPSLEDQLARVRILRDRPIADISDAELLGLLSSKHSIIAAKAAEMAGTGKRAALIPDLLAAFDRFMENPEKNDRGCAAKFAVINALCALDYRDPTLYRRGMNHVQKEASFGPQTDTAAEMRGRCAIALAECGADLAVLEIVEVLVDPEPQARIGAARAISAFGSEEAAAILRLKLLTGDDEPIVLAECCLALLHLSMEQHADFVATFLASADDAVAIDFATSLTESRDPGVLSIMRTIYAQARSSTVRKAVLAALALLRVDGAIEFILERIAADLHAQAKEALDSLKPRRADERLRARIEAVLEKRGDAVLQRHYNAAFGEASPPSR